MAAGALGWYWTRGEPAAEPDATTPAPEAAPGREGETAPTHEEVLAGDLPEVGESDPLARRLAETVSSHPTVAAWLATDGLVRRFVSVTVDVAHGRSPASGLAPVEPAGSFAVRESNGRTFIDPTSYERYEVLTGAFVSLDAERVARVYGRLLPLLDRAYAELGLPGESFEDVLAGAFGRLLAVEVPEGPIEVEAAGGLYEFADPAREALSPAAKHLLRTGPDNARRIQAKLRELSSAMGIRPRSPNGSRP